MIIVYICLMQIERNKTEVIIRISAKAMGDKIESFVDYLKYLEISLKSKASEKELDGLLDNIKSKRKSA